jgi:hypothetical protein
MTKTHATVGEGDMPDSLSERAETDNDPDGWRADLLAAGWAEQSHTIWVAPNGAVYRGPYGAWRAMQRAAKKGVSNG